MYDISFSMIIILTDRTYDLSEMRLKHIENKDNPT